MVLLSHHVLLSIINFVLNYMHELDYFVTGCTDSLFDIVLIIENLHSTHTSSHYNNLPVFTHSLM